MSRQWKRGALGRLVVVALALLTAVFVTGCGSTISGRAEPEANGTVDAISVTKPPTTPSNKPTTAPKPGKTDFQAEIGDCVTLGGTTEDATIDKAACGSPESNYKVIGKTQRSSQCVSDRDSYYVETVNGVEQGAFCLDIDWVVGGCMDVGGDIAKRIDCTPHTKDGVKVLKILQNVADVNSCGAGNSGFVKKERHFVVCVQDL
ncbi:MULTISPECIES: hypothetical protein [unclassified Nocardia]|uniref:LppU family putative lipoprotein n=1 Tax=unclassified Nocardia TaxID=2637762 RepID=UPI001CE3B887|nr:MULTISPECIES: hypothetical protein [unclassified Nocardia]